MDPFFEGGLAFSGSPKHDHDNVLLTPHTCTHTHTHRERERERNTTIWGYKLLQLKWGHLIKKPLFENL